MTLFRWRHGADLYEDVKVVEARPNARRSVLPRPARCRSSAWRRHYRSRGSRGSFRCAYPRIGSDRPRGNRPPRRKQRDSGLSLCGGRTDPHFQPEFEAAGRLCFSKYLGRLQDSHAVEECPQGDRGLGCSCLTIYPCNLAPEEAP
jgi:hypothetical protein